MQVGVDSLQGVLSTSSVKAHDLIPTNAKVVSDQKGLDDWVRDLRENRLPLRKPCIEGTRTAILRKIEKETRNVDGYNVFWITNYRLCRKWIDKKWLRELEKRRRSSKTCWSKEKKCDLSSAEVYECAHIKWIHLSGGQGRGIRCPTRAFALWVKTFFLLQKHCLMA